MVELARVRRRELEHTDPAESERVVLRARRGLNTGGQATSGTRALVIGHVPIVLHAQSSRSRRIYLPVTQEFVDAVTSPDTIRL